MRIINLNIDKNGTVTSDSEALGYSGEHGITKIIAQFEANSVYCTIGYFRILFDDYYSDNIYMSDGVIEYSVPQCALNPPFVSCQICGYSLDENGQPEVIAKTEVFKFTVAPSQPQVTAMSIYAKEPLETAMAKCEVSMLGCEAAEAAVAGFSEHIEGLHAQVTGMLAEAVAAKDLSENAFEGASAAKTSAENASIEAASSASSAAASAENAQTVLTNVYLKTQTDSLLAAKYSISYNSLKTPAKITDSYGGALKNIDIIGKSVQNGTPTPTTHIAIENTGNTLNLKIGTSANDINSTTYSVPLVDINGNTHIMRQFDEVKKHVDGKWYFECNRSIADISSLDWTLNPVGYFQSSVISNIKLFSDASKTTDALCNGLTAKSANMVYAASADNCFAVRNTVLWVRASQYTDASAFKTAMAGVMLEYQTDTVAAYELSAASSAILDGIIIGKGTADLSFTNTVAPTMTAEYPLCLKTYMDDTKANKENTYELIEKIIVGYSLLASAPGDFSTNFSAYYKNTGTVREPIYTALTSAETFAPAKYYSYTAGTATVDRTLEPSGTAYNFSKMYVLFKNTATNATVSSQAFGNLLNGTLCGYVWKSSLPANYYVIRFYPDCGIWFSDMQYENGAFGGEKNTNGTKLVAEYPAILRFRQVACSAGDEIKIYGVRA